MMKFEERWRPGAGVRLGTLEAGVGTPVVLLHGFPDLAWGWRHQLPALAAAGHHAIAPDLRGYGRSDRPRGVRNYAMQHLVADVIELLASLPAQSALVGHDWGGVISWSVATRRPDLVRRLVILNAPHARLYRRELRRNPRQLLRSWYAAFHQLPLLPELAWCASGCALLRRVLGWSETGEQMAGPDELQPYIEAFTPRGAFTAALNYYRAAARDLLLRRRAGHNAVSARHSGRGRGRIDVPTLVIWGERDPYLVARLLDGLDGLVQDLTIERLPHAGHFVHWQDPRTVNALLLSFLE